MHCLCVSQRMTGFSTWLINLSTWVVFKIMDTHNPPNLRAIYWVAWYVPLPNDWERSRLCSLRYWRCVGIVRISLLYQYGKCSKISVVELPLLSNTWLSVTNLVEPTILVSNLTVGPLKVRLEHYNYSHFGVLLLLKIGEIGFRYIRYAKFLKPSMILPECEISLSVFIALRMLRCLTCPWNREGPS